MSNILAEKTALGCMIDDGELAKETILHHDCFTSEYNRIIFDSIMKLVQEGSKVDLITLSTKIGLDNMSIIGGIGYLKDIHYSTTTTTNFEQYEKILVDEWKKRQAILLANTLKERIVEEDETAIAVVAKEFAELEEYGHKHTDSKREVLTRLHESISKRDGKIKGIRTGFTQLDKVTFGFKPGQFIVMGGRPAMGKTAASLCMAINAAELETCVTFFSLEMDKEELYERGVSAIGQISNEKMRHPEERFSESDWKKYNTSFAKLEQIPLDVVDKAGVTVKYIRSVMRKRMRENPNVRHLCVIDYLQLIHGNKKLKRHEEVAEIARSLKEMARDLKISVVALSQLSREIDDRADKRPVLSDLRESGEIEQSADIVIFLYRPAYYKEDESDKTLLELIVAKQRGGRTGTVPIDFFGEYTLACNREVYR